MENKGKKALVLSGGGSRGAYECGVWQALTELGEEFDMIVGSSVGTLNGVLFLQAHPGDVGTFWRHIETDMIFDEMEPDPKLQDFAWEFITKGGAGTTGLKKIIDKYIDEDAVRNSGVDFGLVTVEFPSRKPYYLWLSDIPEGMLADYITASSSAFPALQTYKINGKDFIDGGYADNMPIKMAVDHGATEVFAVFLDAFGVVHKEDFDLPDKMTLLQSKWDLGDFLVFDKENITRAIRLGYLDTMKLYDVYDGNYFSFIKGVFNIKEVKKADIAAKIFELDPTILYGKDYFLECLKEKVAENFAEAKKTPDKHFELRPDIIKSKIANMNKKTIVITLANTLKHKKIDSRYIRKILKNEIKAAEFLVDNKLV